MKKSTIFIVLMIYLVSFFIVGFLGIGIKSAYSVKYVTELTVTPLPDQPSLVLKKEEKTENLTAEGELNTFNYKYSYTFAYQKGTVLKFRVSILPLESTYTDFEFIDNLETEYVQYEIVDKSLIYVTFLRRRAAEFRVQSTDGNKTESIVSITPY